MRTRPLVMARSGRWFTGISSTLLLLLGVWLAAAPAFGEEDEVFSLNIGHYPIVGSCAQVQASVAQRFAAVTHLPVIKVDCFVHTTPKGGNWDPTYDYELTLFYKAAMPLRIESTEGMYSSEPSGMYTDQEDCEGDLAFQAQLFRTETGLEPAFAYCYQEHYLMTHRDWVMHIEGYGRPRNRFLRFSSYVGTTTTAGSEQPLVDAITARLRAAGVHVSKVFFRTDTLGSRTLNIHYYAPQMLGLTIWTMPYAGDGECSYQAPAALNLFRGAGVEPVSMFCTHLAYYELTVLTFWSDKYTVEPLPLRYRTLNECLNDQAHVLQEYQSKPGSDVEGGLCGGLVDYYQLHLFHVPKPS